MDLSQGIDSPKLDCLGTKHLPEEIQISLTSPSQQPVIMTSNHINSPVGPSSHIDSPYDLPSPTTSTLVSTPSEATSLDV